MFTVDLNQRNGAAGVAFFHLSRVAELEPNNFEIQEKLLKLRQLVR
jgi:hypothetical protein